MSATKRILSGMQPTNNLHLGNYLGALRNWVDLQRDDYECLYCVVDLHAMTVPQHPEKLRASTREIAAAYIAAGVDPDNSWIFVQSSVPAHSELMWLLATMTPLGWLNRMTQFKEKAGKKRDNAGLGLFAYPVLMAADILIYKATHVPVGDDQKQHLELTREIAGSFNHHYDTDYFPLPEPLIMGEATRVMSLRDGTKKMSKSEESDMTRINLTDDADTIAKKIRKARTDSEPFPTTEKELENRAEAANLINIYASLSGGTKADVMAKYGGGENFAAFKKDLAELSVEKLSPITERMNTLMDDPAQIDEILTRGGEKANEYALSHLREVQEIMGLWTARSPLFSLSVKGKRVY